MTTESHTRRGEHKGVYDPAVAGSLQRQAGVATSAKLKPLRVGGRSGVGIRDGRLNDR
jgi:hypothetical protein